MIIEYVARAETAVGWVELADPELRLNDETGVWVFCAGRLQGALKRVLGRWSSE